MAWTSGYGGRRDSSPFSSAPGRRALGGGSDSPMPEDEPEDGSLWEHIAGAGLGIPDQFRYQEFAKDMDRRLKKGPAKGKLAALTVVRLPNDHTSDVRPQDGYPYKASFVADNDLALGKIVEKISRS